MKILRGRELNRRHGQGYKQIGRRELPQQADEVNQRYEALLRRKRELQEALATELIGNMINPLLKYREAVAPGLEDPAVEDRRRRLEIFQTTVAVTNGIAVIACQWEVNLQKYNPFGLQTG